MQLQKYSLNFAGKTLVFFCRDGKDRAVFYEVFEEGNYSACKEIIQSAKVIIDVGAHLGALSLFASVLNSNAQIFACEPFEEHCKIFQKNMEENACSSIKLLPVAIANKTETRTLFLSKTASNHSLFTPFFPSKNSVLVQTEILENVFLQNNIHFCDLLKIDAESAELEILESLSDPLWEKIGAIVLEYHSNSIKNALLDLFQKKQFSILQHAPSRYSAECGMLFVVNRNNRCN